MMVFVEEEWQRLAVEDRGNRRWCLWRKNDSDWQWRTTKTNGGVRGGREARLQRRGCRCLLFVFFRVSK